MTKKDLIKEILMKCKASGKFISGDLFLALAFRSKKDLIAICIDCGVKVT